MTAAALWRAAVAWVALAMLATAGPASADHQRTQHVNRSAKGWPLAPFQLQDHQGRALTPAQLRGRWTFVLLGDTRCAQACTEVLATLQGVKQRIARTDAWASTQVIFLSTDPLRDSPQRLRDYLAAFDSGFLGVTGSATMLRQFVDDLALAAGSGDQAGDRRGALVLIGPDVVVRAEYLPPYDVKLLTADYMTTRARR